MPLEALDILQPATSAASVLAATSTCDVIGIDPSLTGFAWTTAQPGGDGGYKLNITTNKSKPAASPAQRVQRYRALVRPVVQHVITHRPELVCIEAPVVVTHRGRASGVHTQMEMRGILYDRLCDHTTVVEVAPQTLKKFAAGAGNASKEDVLSQLTKRYGRAFSSNDESDSYALCLLGLVALGRMPAATKAQDAAAKTVRAKIAEARSA